MRITVFEITVPQFILTLTSLKHLLQKAHLHAEKRNIEMGVLLNTRLAPDQFALGKQVEIACDVARFCVARLTGTEAPQYAEPAKGYHDLLNRIDDTIHFMQKITPTDFEGYEGRKVTYPWYPGHYLDGHNYLVQHALPNFYFHVTTAYGILRFSGVDIGKADYLGEQNWKKES
ncbi:MAG: DUF1993 domain-containing protein [Bdellovibrionaceae bacterium]|nr:DUF1993 domain-containing protein [Pseudobdellovibrionaceae bacterium]